VGTQTHPVAALSIAVDLDKQGAAITRNRAWRALSTDYVAFLDDDDEFLPMHIERCLATAEDTDADLVYPWFELPVGHSPFPDTHFTDPWNPDAPVQTTITCLWKRSALELIGGFPEEFADSVDGGGNRNGEDFLAVTALQAAGGKIVHLAERTWLWHWHGSWITGVPGEIGNTSGLNTRW
jgi:glycosyltransferase involved in cell wall biosynthesis